MEPMVAEFPPRTRSDFSGIPLNGGRVQAIAVRPALAREMIVAAQCGGLWKTEDIGRTWTRLDGLRTFRAMDVAYLPDGDAVVATVARDNRVRNGGGIWVSRDRGATWAKPGSIRRASNWSRSSARAWASAMSPRSSSRAWATCRRSPNPASATWPRSVRATPTTDRRSISPAAAMSRP